MHLIQVAQGWDRWWVGSCEHGNEPSRSTNGWQCLDCLNTRLAPKETLCFTELLMIMWFITNYCGNRIIEVSTHSRHASLEGYGRLHHQDHTQSWCPPPVSAHDFETTVSRASRLVDVEA
jgi:hypothetical protein